MSAVDQTLVGVYGGTFNPIHLGHLRAAEEVSEALGLAKMIFVPSARPPHKRASGDEMIAPAKQRLAWVRLAVEAAPNPLSSALMCAVTSQRLVQYLAYSPVLEKLV